MIICLNYLWLNIQSKDIINDEIEQENVITISSNCSNMSELDGYGDKKGFYRCLKMIQSLGYSEKETLDMLKSDFERFDETVYDEYVNNPELFISAITD